MRKQFQSLLRKATGTGNSLCAVRPSPLGISATIWPSVPVLDDDDDDDDELSSQGNEN
jgi:hypothetical protein